MCGFAGEMRFDGRPADLAAVEKMSDRMQRRGPDGCGAWQRGPVALAHRRLTIIDLSRAGEQPMVDSDLGLSLVFNGCIYNYADLRARARGLRLPLLLDLGHRGDHQGVSPLGRGLRRALPAACSPSSSSSATAAAW